MLGTVHGIGSSMPSGGQGGRARGRRVAACGRARGECQREHQRLSSKDLPPSQPQAPFGGRGWACRLRVCSCAVWDDGG